MESWNIEIHSYEELKEYSEDIVQKYANNLTVSQIAREYKAHIATVTKVLEKAGCQIKKKEKLTDAFFEQEKDNIRELYLEKGLSPEEIGKIYNKKKYQINYILDKMGITKTISEAKRKYTLDEHFFDKIDTPNKAYILGFLYADGCNNKVINTITLGLDVKDKDILEKIQKAIGTDRPLYDSIYFAPIFKEGDAIIKRHMVILSLSSKYMSDTVEKWGVIPRKTFDLVFPDFLSEGLYSHFSRGYFDGDGWASLRTTNEKYPRQRLNVGMMSSMTFCLGMQKYLKNKCNIFFNVNHPSGHKKENGIIRSSSKEETKKFMDFIYKDAELYIERKYNNFKKFFDNN